MRKIFRQPLVRKGCIVLALFVLWEGLTRFFELNPLLFRPASQVIDSLIESTVGGELPG